MTFMPRTSWSSTTTRISASSWSSPSARPAWRRARPRTARRRWPPSPSDAPDLVVLDINMPRMDGLEVCRRLRAQGDLPILFLSSRDDEIDRVLGIELGADDYVVKPFSPREVVARVAAILRRVGPAPPAGRAAGRGARGRLRLDPDGWSARWGDAEVPLTVTEFGILRALAAAPQQGLQPRRHHRPPARSGLRRHRPHHRQPRPQPARQVRRRWAATT